MLRSLGFLFFCNLFFVSCISMSEHKMEIAKRDARVKRIDRICFSKEKELNARLRKSIRLNEKFKLELNDLLVDKLKHEEAAIELRKSLKKKDAALKDSKSKTEQIMLQLAEYREKELDWNNSSESLKKKVMLLENEVLVKEKAKKRFVCKGFNCYKAAVESSDKFWDMYSAVAFEFLGRSVHRRELEKERKRVLKEWRKAKLWEGSEVRVDIDWVTGDRKTFMNLSFENYYGDNGYSLSPRINPVKIELVRKKDMDFAESVKRGMYNVKAYITVKLRKKANRFWGRTTYHREIVVKVKRVEFEPNTEEYTWGSVPKNRVFKRISNKELTYYID